MNPELLQMMMQNPEAGREQLQAAFAERVAANPQLGMMMQMMNQRAAQAPAEPRAGRDLRIARVRERVAEMRDELSRLRERNEKLAAALGACAHCWGDDATCTACGGDGGPGWLAPNPIQFTEFVAPAVSRLADGNADSEQES